MRHYMTKLIALFCFAFSTVFAALEDYEIAWTTPSKNAAESMPCGGGDIGLNVWVENGDLLVYLSRSGTFDELNGMPKLGRLRITLEPNPFLAGREFHQELKLREGRIEVRGTNGALSAKLTVWVDAFLPVVHVGVESSAPTAVTAAYENWRQSAHEQQSPEEMGANRSYVGAPEKAVVRPDHVDFAGRAVQFYHRNGPGTAFDLLVAQQGLESVKDRMWNPLADLTFGGSFSGNYFSPAGTREGRYASTPFTAWLLHSDRPALKHELQATLHTASPPQLATWLEGLHALEEKAAQNPTSARRRTEKWWHDFWERSHVFIDPDRRASDPRVWQAGRNYQVFRYQLGCNARGTYPTKFNGGLFTFDPEYVDPAARFSPDVRKWGGGSFTAQNQRLVYWPMLKSGDFDLMQAQFEFYRRARVNAELRSQVYWGIQGASFTEQIESFGLPVGFEYNWKRRPGAEPGIEDSAWVDHQWDTVFEFCQMMLEEHAYTGADIRPSLPLIESCLSFFDEYYQQQARQRTGSPLSEDQKLVIFPGTALETYKDALNPATTLSSLRSVLTSLLALPAAQLPAERRDRWSKMLTRIPGLAFREIQGRQTLAPAWKWSRIQNVELPQLYPVYPWGLFGIGRPNLAVAIDTWKLGADRPEQKQIQSWHQDAIFCARLGLTAEAAELTLQKMKDSGRRFPTWWGPGHDWVPDHNWGGSGMIGVQEMLLQTVDRKIYVLPAWPRDWDVDFKLHAPGNTTVEVVLKSGKITRLTVSPEDRAADLVLPTWHDAPPGENSPEG